MLLISRSNRTSGSVLSGVVSFVCGGLLLCAGALPARADATADTVAIDIEVAEATSKDTLALTLTLAGEHGCSSVKERRGAVGYEVEVCRDGGEAAAPVLKFKLDRTENTSSGGNNISFRLSGRMTPGKRVKLGKLSHRGGDSTEISATIR